jgi:pimeloyl-ACP methyl ester carboxylesterase
VAPGYGYRIARLAADVSELVSILGVNRVDALGWSMGASVWWSYVDLFGTSRIRSLVIVDQPAMIVKAPWMTSADQADVGALWDLSTLEQIIVGQINLEPESIDAESLRWTYSGEIEDAILDALVTDMRLASPHAVGTLLFDHSVQNWTDVLPRIDVPTLVIGAEGSHVSTHSQRYIAGAVPDASAQVFTAAVASSHFSFLQNPSAFEEAITAFLPTGFERA